MYSAAAGGAGQDMWRVYAMCCEPNASPRGRSGVTPLQKALRYADLKVAEISAAALLSNNTNPNVPSNADSSPLHIAAERGSVEMVEMLIRLGARVDQLDNNGKTPLQVAEAGGKVAAAAMLTKHREIPRTCRTSRTRYAADGSEYAAPDIRDIPQMDRRRFVGQAHGNLEYVRKATSREPRMVHSVATTSEISVEAGAHIGRKPIVEFLLTNGAPYSLPTAVFMNDREVVKKYLDEDPNRIHERGAHDYPLLWYPIIGRCPVAMMELLIERGASVEQQHFLGTTALHMACLRDNVEMAEFLVAQGADVTRVGRKFNPKGETPLHLARAPKIIEFLKSKGAKRRP